jgi:hypothetical protein
MNELYHKLVQKTVQKRQDLVAIPDETEQNMLTRHISEVFDMIIYGFEENLTEAAERGSNVALLCIYKVDSKLRGVIPMHDLLIMTERLSQKLKDYGIMSLIERLKEKFNPFTINVKQLRDIIQAVDENRSNIYCVTVAWEVETPELVT